MVGEILIPTGCGITTELRGKAQQVSLFGGQMFGGCTVRPPGNPCGGLVLFAASWKRFIAP
jgi:hypothetical protein